MTQVIARCSQSGTVYWMLSALLACGLFSGNLKAQSIDFNAHGEAYRFTYAAFTGRNVVTDVGVLSTEKGNQDWDQAWHLGLNAAIENFRLGARMIYASPGATDVLAVGLGGGGKFYLGRNVSFGLLFYYAPEFSSFMDAEGYSELGLRLNFKVSKPLELYLGYRNFKVAILDVRNKLELDDDLHLGLKFYF